MNISEKEMQYIEQCKNDRDVLVEISTMNKEERLDVYQAIGKATIESLENGDSLNVARRLECLYASLSIHSYEGIVTL